MPSAKRILIASDHAGWALKVEIKKILTDWDWEDLGPLDCPTEKLDYPDFAQRLGRKITEEEGSRGVLICGSGIGMSIAANKVSGIRAAVVENPIAARLASEHNHANVLCLGSRFTAAEYGAEIITSWLKASPSHEGRHGQRIKKIQRMENGETL
jgi:ribose 5-phosphate isomerase B